MSKYQPILSLQCPLGRQTIGMLRPLFADLDFCEYFHIDIHANEATKLRQLRWYYLEWHTSEKHVKTVEMLGKDPMLYRWSRAITGTVFW